MPCVKRVASAFRSGGTRTSRENEIIEWWGPFTVKRDGKQKIPSPGNLSSASCSNGNRLTENTRMQAEHSSTLLQLVVPRYLVHTKKIIRNLTLVQRTRRFRSNYFGSWFLTSRIFANRVYRIHRTTSTKRTLDEKDEGATGGREGATNTKKKERGKSGAVHKRRWA